MRVQLAQTFKFCITWPNLFYSVYPHESRINVNISMLNSTITMSQMHIPPKTHFQKAVGGVKKFCGHLSRMEVTPN